MQPSVEKYNISKQEQAGRANRAGNARVWSEGRRKQENTGQLQPLYYLTVNHIITAVLQIL